MAESERHLVDLYKGLGDLHYDFRNYNLIRLIASKINGESVLDIGCGSGFLLDILYKKGKKTFGIEPNKELVKSVRTINPKLKIFNAVAEDIDKYITQRVDVITMIDSLEHIEKDNIQIKKNSRHLNEKGQLIIVVPAFQFLYGKRDNNMGHYRRYSKKRLIQILSINGFKIISLRYWNMMGFLPYLFSEKILKKELNTELRTGKKKGIFKKILNLILNLWFRYIENNISFGFGLSLICIAEKK